MAKRNLITVALATIAICFGWSMVGEADAAQEITEFETSVSSTQAGGHPDVDYKVAWTNRAGSNLPCNCEDSKILDMHFPTGFIGNPHSVPACSLAEFSMHSCAPETQVGALDILGSLRQAVYNLVPHESEPGLVGFFVPGARTTVFTVLHARTGSDYGLDATSSAVYHILPLNSISLHIWGVPADPSHDANRFPAGKTEGVECEPYPGACFGPVASTATPAPYLQNPTTCGVPLTAVHTIEYYTGTIVSAADDWPATTGCDQLTFNPSLTATPTTESADSMSGLDATLKVPQSQSPTSPSPSEIRALEMTLPEGFTLSSNAANGKLACSDTELEFETESEAHCPEFSKIGTSTIDSSALPGPIEGGIYIGQPLPGQTYRIFVTGDGFATHVKLKGVADLDPETGQIVTSFTDLPQSPVQEVDLHFFGSERGVFSTPARCGTYPVVTRFTPWDAALEDQTSTSTMKITSGPNGAPCPGNPGPFRPTMTAGTADNTAGASAPFTIEVERADGDQYLTGLSVKTPPGFLASLRGLAYCSEAAITEASNATYSVGTAQGGSACSASSRVGSVKVAAGTGSRPIYVAGGVYIAGPYKGAPISLVFVVPTVSGPYDFGNIVVRAPVQVDRRTIELNAVSDPLPIIQDGVPLRLRYLQVRLDRQGFSRNPTRCDPFSVGASLLGAEAGRADLTSHFQVANCASLEYSPSLSVSLGGGLKVRGHPSTHAVLKADPGESNTRKITTTLPKGLQIDNSHLRTICTRVQFAVGACPEGSRTGQAEVSTPLLDQPLRGSVYLRASSHRLPDLVMDLRGQIDIEISARIEGVNGRLRATFDSLPDAPVGRVKLDLLGRAKGLLVNSEGLCGKQKRLTADLTGQNGDILELRPKLKMACGSNTSRSRRVAR